MKLRELITQLEKLSDKGKNDNLDIGIVDKYYMCSSVKNIYIDTFYPFENNNRFIRINI